MMYLHNNKQLFEEVVSATSNEIKLPIPIIEKDYYVTMILRELAKREPKCIFKGGTSLSKCYHVIDRFSEDIDIAFSDELGRGARKQFKENVVIKISEELGMPIPAIDDIWSKADYQCYIYNYSPIDGYVPESLFPGIKMEVVLSSKAFPTEKATVDSYVYQFLKKDNMDLVTEYGLEPFEMNVQSLERTFIDKVFALCDYYMNKDLKLHSRHIFDIYMLLHKMEFNDEFGKLVKEVREHRQKMGRCPSSASDVNISTILSLIIENSVFEDDYENITSYFQKTKIEYNEAIKAIQKVIDSKVF